MTLGFRSRTLVLSTVAAFFTNAELPKVNSHLPPLRYLSIGSLSTNSKHYQHASDLNQFMPLSSSLSHSSHPKVSINIIYVPVTVLSSCDISYFDKDNFTNIKVDQYHLLSKIAFYLDSNIIRILYKYYNIITFLNSLSSDSNEI